MKKRNWLIDELDAFDTAQSIDAWDDANEIGDNELDQYISKANEAANDAFGWPDAKPQRLYSNVLGKMIDTKTGKPVEE